MHSARDTATVENKGSDLHSTAIAVRACALSFEPQRDWREASRWGSAGQDNYPARLEIGSGRFLRGQEQRFPKSLLGERGSHEALT